MHLALCEILHWVSDYYPTIAQDRFSFPTSGKDDEAKTNTWLFIAQQ